ncbi:MAG: hypothetical protein DHS20C18_40260 [Saprospiraceae bacterium]|nr:MAG: hypothetical protein DHS20C18_40260 [Saprospiraceae bacterium]
MKVSAEKSLKNKKAKNTKTAWKFDDFQAFAIGIEINYTNYDPKICSYHCLFAGYPN